jgi:predicted RNA-binding protein with PUA-like domain
MATWIVRAGSEDQYLDQCLTTGVAAIGWKEVRGKTAIKDVDFNDIYHKLQEIYPTDSNHTIGAYTSQIHAFANKIFGGDFILIPSGKGKRISVGYLLGEVEELPANESLLATRRVLWLVKEAERQEFLDQVKGTSAIENPRTVIQTAINHQDIRSYVEKKTNSDFWKLLGSAGINSWVFQSNPSKWSLLEAIEKNVNNDWAANQNRDKMKIGDLIIFRQSEPNSGVYALGHLMKEPVNRGENIFGEWGVVVSFDYKIDAPLLKQEIVGNKELASITQINGLQGSNFSIPSETAQFLLSYLEPRLKVIEAKSASEIQYWWCNVGVTKKPAIATGTLWAHAASKNGAVLTHHTDMKKIRKGDQILLYADTKVVAIGSCTVESVDSTRPIEYPDKISSPEDDSQVPGFVVRANFQELANPIPFKEIEEDLRSLVDDKGPLAISGGIKMGYLYPLSKEFGEKFMERFGGTVVASKGETNMEIAATEESLTALAKKLLVPEDWLSEVIGQIEESKQVIFYGPPGTGKTYIGKAIAQYLASKENTEIIQFHPSFSYEDFFEGFRPAERTDGSVSLEKVDGPLKRIASAARSNPDKKYVLIIDEINRGNLAKVFGELYFLLEYRDEEISLMYSKEEKFALPKNLFFIGTMNTSDRSIALVDSAIRRRFRFIHLDPTSEPCSQILSKWLKANNLPAVAGLLLENLNEALAKYEFSVGPAYFMKESTQSRDSLQLTWKYSIEPLLEEYFFGEWAEKHGEFTFDKIHP